MTSHPHRGVILTVGAIGLIFLIGGIVRWESVDRALALGERPTGLMFVLCGAWSLVSALTTVPKPYNGLLLVLGTLLAVPVMSHQAEEAADLHSYGPLALGLGMFALGGAMLMLTAKISTETRDRRPWLQEAWPGIVLLVSSLAVMAIVATMTVPRIHYVPPTMLPAERGP
jgi:hypothetical protein